MHANEGNKNAFKALIAAEYSGVAVELAKGFQMGVSNRTPEFLKMNPIGKVWNDSSDFRFLLGSTKLILSCTILCSRFLSWRLLTALFVRAML